MRQSPLRKVVPALLICASPLGACATTSAVPPAHSIPSGVAALPAADPEPAVRIVEIPRPLPLPGQLKPVGDGASPPEPADPRRRVGVANDAARVQPVRDGWLAMSARLCALPASDADRDRLVTEIGKLAAGMLAAHFTVTRGHVHSFAQVNWLAIVLSMATAVGLATYTSVRHRSAKLSVLTPHFRQQSWQDKLLCGAAILLLHWLLVNTFPLHLGDPKGESDGIALMVIVLVFAIAVSMEQLSNMRWDAGRQQLLRRGLSMMRVSNMSQTAERDMERGDAMDRRPERLRDQIGVRHDLLVLTKDLEEFWANIQTHEYFSYPTREMEG